MPGSASKTRISSLASPPIPPPSALRSPRAVGAGLPVMRSPSPQRVSFWPAPIDTEDENWRRERLSGVLARRQHRMAECKLEDEKEAVAATLIAELADIDSELLRTRRGSQGLWASRRILVDEVQALRHRVAEQDALLRQKEERIAFLERQCAFPTRAALYEPRTPQRVVGSDQGVSSARTAALEARIDSELAVTQAELMAVAYRAASPAMRTPLTRLP